MMKTIYVYRRVICFLMALFMIVSYQVATPLQVAASVSENSDIAQIGEEEDQQEDSSTAVEEDILILEDIDYGITMQIPSSSLPEDIDPDALAIQVRDLTEEELIQTYEALGMQEEDLLWSYDISLVNSETGEEVQPGDKVTLIKSDYAEEAASDKAIDHGNISVYRMDPIEDTDEVRPKLLESDVDAEEEALSFTTDHFTVYTAADGTQKYDFTNDITSVTLYAGYDIANSPVVVPIIPGYDLAPDYGFTESNIWTLRVEYTLPGGVLNDNLKTITYKAPTLMQMENVASGSVYGSNGAEIGTYTIEDGLVSITFFDSYVKNNENGNPISGYISWGFTMVEDKDDDDGTFVIDFTGDHKITVKFLQLDKKGRLTSDDSMVTWTVNVNENGANIGGYTLTDELDGVKYEPDDVTLTNNTTGEVTTISLPYTFPSGDHSSYTLTYQTVAQPAAGKEEIKNKVSLYAGDNGVSSEDSVTVKKFDPLRKSGELVSVDDDIMLLKWTVVIDTTDYPIQAGSEIVDFLWYTGLHHMSADDVRNFRAELDTALAAIGMDDSAYTLKAGASSSTMVDVDNLIDTTNYHYMTLTFDKEIPKGNRLEMTYYTHVESDKVTDRIWVGNTITINGGGSKGPNVPVNPINGEPSLTKIDPISGASSQYTYDETSSQLTATSNEAGGLIPAGTKRIRWRLRTAIPKNYTATGDLVITEKLPALISYEDIAVGFWHTFGGNSVYYTLQEGYQRLEVGKKSSNPIADSYIDVTVTKSEDGDVITFVIPASFANDPNVTDTNILDIGIYAKLVSDEWEVNSDNRYIQVYNNSATLTLPSGTTQTDTNTITIRGGSTGPTDVVTKEALDQITDNDVTYSIIVNPQRENLVDGDVITIEDVLSYVTPEGALVEAGLKGSSISIEEVIFTSTTEYTTRPLEENEYTLGYQEKVDNDTNEQQRVMTLTLKDETAYLITYKYHVTGTIDATVVLNNNVTIKGYKGDDNNSETTTRMRIETSKAGADTNFDQIVLKKVDSENMLITLPGAKFTLQEVVSGDIIYEDLESDIDGLITLGTTEFKMNTLYALIETEAPSGYFLAEKPFYFYVGSEGYTMDLTDTGLTTDEVRRIVLGETMNVENTSNAVVLPDTGGMGSDGIKRTGILLIAAAAILYVVKKRRLLSH